MSNKVTMASETGAVSVAVTVMSTSIHQVSHHLYSLGGARVPEPHVSLGHANNRIELIITRRMY